MVLLSESDQRIVNNTDKLRHNYRVLSEEEKAQMVAVKDMGQKFLDLIETLRTPLKVTGGMEYDTVVQYFDRELVIASERVEEAVMWAVKHVTGSKE